MFSFFPFLLPPNLFSFFFVTGTSGRPGTGQPLWLFRVPLCLVVDAPKWSERVVGRNFSPNSEEMRHWRFRLFEVIFGLVKVAAYYDLSRGRGAGLAAGGGAGVAARDGAGGA